MEDLKSFEKKKVSQLRLARRGNWSCNNRNETIGKKE
jgi:hypothetical protein